MSFERIVCADGTEINVADVGDKSPTLVFLHYWGGSSRTWAPVIESLSETNRCVAIDFRGWGRSSKMAQNYRLETLGDDVISVVEHLGLRDFVIVGHSMGGKVAQIIAARLPRGLKRLILVAPAPPTPLDIPEEQRRAMITSYETKEGAAAVIDILSAVPLSDAHREQVIEDTLSGALDAKRAWPEKGMAEDVSRRAATIAVPVHVIVGSADTIEPESSLRATFEKVLPGVEFIVLPGVGHLAPLEAPAAVVDAIRSAQDCLLRRRNLAGEGASERYI